MKGGAVEVDARGLSCPLPLLRARVAVVRGARALTVLVSTGSACSNVVDLLCDEGFDVRVEEDAEGYRIDASSA